MAEDIRVTAIEKIRECIHWHIIGGNKQFIIYPYGIAGYMVHMVLVNDFGIEPVIVDNNKSKQYGYVKDSTYLNGCGKDAVVIVATHNVEIEKVICNQLDQLGLNYEDVFRLIVGKHSFGGLLSDHNGWLIESIGGFCSFASGTCVVANHNIRKGVSTSAFFSGIDLDMDVFEEQVYISNDNLMDNKRVKIGNDVWLGKNVILTDGVKIGDGAIVGAGAVITHDVLDYAIVVGVPGRVIKYRYSEEQIGMLKQIKWWEWSDEQILAAYDDFADVTTFLNKYGS